jgi:D-beta-D-heptose 7-phosphate kinase/D-beta-D-heptose 1-phosphate adenosyltransferase
MIETISRDRLVALLKAGRRQRVVVIGDAMLDVYLRGDVSRISPEAPVPVVRVTERKLALGGAANVAQNVLAIGAVCELVCAIGADREGEQLRNMLTDLGGETRSLVPVARPTTTKTRVLARAQQVVRFDEEEDADVGSADLATLLDRAAAAIDGANAVVLQDYNKGVLIPSFIQPIMQLAKKKKVPVVVDPKFRNFFAYGGASIFKPNRRELEAAVGASVDLEHPQALPDMLARLGVDNLLLTLGEAGMALISAQGEVGRIPTTAREVYDVVGAGDTVTAYLATMLAAGATPSEASVIANFSAGVVVAKLGAATVSIEEVVEAYDLFSAAA